MTIRGIARKVEQITGKVWAQVVLDYSKDEKGETKIKIGNDRAEELLRQAQDPVFFAGMMGQTGQIDGVKVMQTGAMNVANNMRIQPFAPWEVDERSKLLEPDAFFEWRYIRSLFDSSICVALQISSETRLRFRQGAYFNPPKLKGGPGNERNAPIDQTEFDKMMRQAMDHLWRLAEDGLCRQFNGKTLLVKSPVSYTRSEGGDSFKFIVPQQGPTYNVAVDPAAIAQARAQQGSGNRPETRGLLRLARRWPKRRQTRTL